MKPVAEFVARWMANRNRVVDPFCGMSKVAHVRNDLAAGGVDAVEFLKTLADAGERFDGGLFDPPYSPSQMSRSYKNAGINRGEKGSQTARLYRECAEQFDRLIEPGGVVLRFGWNSCGMGKSWALKELLLVAHGGAHYDTICCAWEKCNPPPVETQPGLFEGE